MPPRSFVLCGTTCITLNFAVLAVGFMAHLGRALKVIGKAGVPPRFYVQCGAAYAALTLAAVIITRTELQLPLVHYCTQREVRFYTPCPQTKIHIGGALANVWCSPALSGSCRRTCTAAWQHPTIV